jgi:hypothetical protein
MNTLPLIVITVIGLIILCVVALRYWIYDSPIYIGDKK